MSEVAEVQVEDVETEELEYTEEESRAMEHGWSPKDQWKGDPDDWVNARSFIKRGELFGKIRSLERDRDSMRQEFKQATSAMRDILKKTKETEYNRAVKELKERKRTALEEGEVAAVMGIDDDIAELTTTHQRDVAEMTAIEHSLPTPAQPSQEFIQWRDRNTWYDDDPTMRITADNIGVRLAQETPNASLTDIFKEVDKHIRKVYPERFGNKPRVSKVNDGDTRTPSTRGSGGKSKYSVRDLNAEQRDIMNTMVKSGVMTQEDYINELANIGEIGS